MIAAFRDMGELEFSLPAFAFRDLLFQGHHDVPALNGLPMEPSLVAQPRFVPFPDDAPRGLFREAS